MKNVCLFLFDVSGKMAQPWLEAGYECWIVDVQHPVSYDTQGITRDGNLFRVHADLRHPWLCPVDRNRIAFVFAFPPCDHLAVSGARWFHGKGLRRLSLSPLTCSLLPLRFANGLGHRTVSKIRSVQSRRTGESRITHSARSSSPGFVTTTTTRRRHACGSATASSCLTSSRMKVLENPTTVSTNVRPARNVTTFAVQPRLGSPVPCLTRTHR